MSNNNKKILLLVGTVGLVTILVCCSITTLYYVKLFSSPRAYKTQGPREWEVCEAYIIADINAERIRYDFEVSFTSGPELLTWGEKETFVMRGFVTWIENREIVNEVPFACVGRYDSPNSKDPRVTRVDINPLD